MKSTIKTVENDFKADLKEVGVDTSTTQLIPGYSDEKMLIGAQTRGSSGVGIFGTSITVNATGDTTVTGCPFTPKYAIVHGFIGFAGCTSTSSGFSSGSAGSIAGNSDGGVDSSNSYIVILRNNSGTVTHRATFSSFTSDGCVINFSTATGTAAFLVTLFG